MMDLGFWLLNLVGEQMVAGYVNNNIQMIGPTYTYEEKLLAKSLLNNSVKGSLEEVQLLNSGPAYVTNNGLVPVSIRPYRTADKELLFLVTSNMPEEYIHAIAKASKEVNGVLVLRGLVNDSVEETMKFAAPLSELGALVQINPIPSETFRHRTYRKAPLVVKAKVNAKGEYGCESSEPCKASIVVGGVVHPPFGKYDVMKTLEFMGELQ